MKRKYINKIHKKHVNDKSKRRKNYEMYQIILEYYLSLGNSLNITCEKVYLYNKLEKYSNKNETMKAAIIASIFSSIIVTILNPDDMMTSLKSCRDLANTIIGYIPQISNIRQIIAIVFYSILLLALFILVSLSMFLGVYAVQFAFYINEKKEAREIEYYSMCLEVIELLEKSRFINNHNEMEKINCIREKVQLDKYKRRHQEDTSPILDKKYSDFKIRKNNDEHSNIST